MPPRIVTPMDESEMFCKLETPENNRYTLCQILRELYLSSDGEEVKFKCRLGLRLAKDMADRLFKLDLDWRRSFWPSREQYLKEIGEE